MGSGESKHLADVAGGSCPNLRCSGHLMNAVAERRRRVGRKGCLSALACARTASMTVARLAGWNVNEFGSGDATRILSRSCADRSVLLPESTGTRTAASVTLSGFGLRELVTLDHRTTELGRSMS